VPKKAKKALKKFMFRALRHDVGLSQETENEMEQSLSSELDQAVDSEDAPLFSEF